MPFPRTISQHRPQSLYPKLCGTKVIFFSYSFSGVASLLFVFLSVLPPGRRHRPYGPEAANSAVNYYVSFSIRSAAYCPAAGLICKITNLGDYNMENAAACQDDGPYQTSVSS